MRIAGKPFTLPSDLTRQIKFVSPNIFELAEIANALNYTSTLPTDLNLDELLSSHSSDLKTLAAQVNDHVDNILITLGSKGALLVRKNFPASLFFNRSGQYNNKQSPKSEARFYLANPIGDVVNVSGAGDSFNAGFISAMIRGMPEAICVSVGFQGAITALRSMAAVPEAYFSMEHSCWKKGAAFREFWLVNIFRQFYFYDFCSF